MNIRDNINENIEKINNMLVNKDLSEIFDSTLAIKDLTSLPYSFITATDNLYESINDLEEKLLYTIENSRKRLKEDISTFLIDSHNLMFKLFDNLTEVSEILSSEQSKIMEMVSYHLNNTDTSYYDIIIKAADILKEYPEKETVLNGWIFASFGLLDVWKASSEEKYKKLWNDSIRAIQATLNKFDAGHWSYYNLGKMYTSDFYHSLHIELLKALDAIAPNQNYKKYIKKWSECKDSSLWSKIAFIHKAAQKLSEKQTQEWVMIS